MTADLTMALHYSPEMQRRLDNKYGQGRRLSPEAGNGSRDFLSASLPGAITSGDLQKCASSSTPASPSRSLSVRNAGHRPRSASLFSGGSRIRRSLRLARPGSGSRRWKSQEGSSPESSTDYIDSTLARIHQQLAQFSEEDHAFKERIERLSVQINELHNFHNVQRKHQEAQDERDGSHSCPPEPTRQDTVSPRVAQPLPTYQMKVQHRRSLSLGQIDFLMEVAPDRPDGGARCATLKQTAMVHRSPIPILRISSSKGELMPLEEALEASNEARGGEEGGEEGGRSSKLSSIESRSGTDTPDGQGSEFNSRSSSAASSVIPDIDVMIVVGGQDSEGLFPPGGVKESGVLLTPQSVTEDEVFFTL